MILITEDLVGNIDNTSILPGFRSDHSIVMMEHDSTIQPRGRGYWKLNTSIFSDRDYVKSINNCIDEAKLTYENENPAIKLEMLELVSNIRNIKQRPEKLP